MRKILGVLTTFTLLITFVAVGNPARATTAPATFTFNFDDYGNNTFPNQTNSTASLTPAPACPGDPCNATSSFGVDPNYGSYWQWTSTDARGGGFTVDTTGLIGNTYSIAMTFSLNQVTGWRKIIDYQNRVSDTGFYVLSGALQFYPEPTANFTFTPNELINLVAVRDATTDPSNPTFKVYLAGPNGTYTEKYSFVDSTGMAIPYNTNGHTILGFFFDDLATSSEATNAGKIYDLRMWQNIALTSSDLNAVYSQAIASSSSPSPSPSSSPSSSSDTTSTPLNTPAQENQPQLANTGAMNNMTLFGIASILVLMGILFIRKALLSVNQS